MEMTDRSDKAGQGHPLPASEKARRDRLPEHFVEEKGLGDDAGERVQPAADPVDPDGEPYRTEGPEGNC
jgi:hypothetical protein